MWPALAMMATLWLAGTAEGWAADAPAATSATAPTQTVGKLTLNGAGAYEGEIRDGKANGKGTLTFEGGRKYVGEFRDNKRYGQGTWTIWGFKYEGGWQDDSYHGQGAETYPKGLTYVGEFKDGYRCGQGTMTFPDGRKYEGGWKRNLFHGPGTLTAKDGKQQAGRWELGEYRGPAAAQPANIGGIDLPSELGDAPGLALAVERLLREGTPAVRVDILRAIGRVASNLDLSLLGRLLIFGTAPAGAEQREAIEAIAATRAGGALDPAGLAALFDQVQKDKTFAARGIVDFFAEIYTRRCQRQANDFNALFPKGVDRLAALRTYAEKASTEGALDEWGNRVRAALAESASGLVVWYKFDEGARDSSPNGLHGSIDGTVSWEKGFIGSGAAGCRSGSIRLPDIRDRFTTEATLSVWIKMDSAEALGQGMLGFSLRGGDYYPDTGGWMRFQTFNEAEVAFRAPVAVDRTKWHHLAVTYKPGTNNRRFHLNGALVASNTVGAETISLPAGCRIGGVGASYAGAAFDDFRLYSRALSADEVRDQYRLGIEPAAPNSTPPPAGGGTAVLVDEDTVWRHLHLEGPSCFMLDDPAPVLNYGAPEIVKTAFGPMAKVGMPHGSDSFGWSSSPGGWRSELTSPAPPSDWAGVTCDDSLWLRTCWPQPLPDLTWNAPEDHGFLKRAQAFDTVVVLARSRFEIKDPQRVKACRLSLDYWGGVVVYVNGKEAARGHLAGQETNLLARMAEPYPEKVLPFGSCFASVGCLRQLREVEIPAAFLRPGVNVLAVEAHPAPIPYSTWKRYDARYAWPAIGVKRAHLTVASADAAVTNGLRLQGLQVWNCAVSDTLTIGNDLRETGAPVQPVLIRAARNSVFSGRLVVGSDQAIKGLTVSVGDLVRLRKSSSSSAKRSSSSNARVENEDEDDDEGGAARIPAAAIRVRYAVPATAGKSWVPQGRFDGLLDQVPAEIPLCVASTATKALAPLWFTVRVPATVTAGRYEGRITIAAQGFPPQTVPLHVQVCDWTMPDVQDWRMQNFIYHAEEVEAKYYGVTNYSARHLELVGKTLAVLAEVNSRQVMANLVCDFFANGYSGSMNSNPESLVRWVKQPDGTFKHDFTNFDRYLDMVAKTIGKPRTLRLNCWGEYNPKRAGTPWVDGGFDNTGERPVTVFDPATGQLSRMKQPPLGTEESYRFWKPVFDEVLKKIKARGWLEETTLGYNAWFSSSFPTLVDVANRLWPGGEWSFTGHNGSQDMLFQGSDTNLAMVVRHSDTVYVWPRMGTQTAPKEENLVWAKEGASKIYMRAQDRHPLWLLDGPRRNTFTYGCRLHQRDDFPLNDMRLLAENYALNNGFDGLGDFGANLYPLKKPVGGYYIPAAGAGTGWSSDYRSTLALLYPGPDGPVATERFEALREGLELCEAVVSIRSALAKKRELLSADLQQRAERFISERDLHYPRLDFHVRYMQADTDAKLLDMAGEVARELEQKK